MYWLSPLADPDDFVTNNYKCGMAINVQKSCSPEMDAILEEAKARRHAGRAQSGLQEDAGAFAEEMGIVPLVNGWLLIAHTRSFRISRRCEPAS